MHCEAPVRKMIRQNKDWCKKIWLRKKIPYLFRISWKFSISKSCSNLLNSSYGIIQSSYGTIFSAFPSLFLQCTFLTGFYRSWVYWPTICLKMLLKMVQNCSMRPYVWRFRMVLLPWDARNTICLALIEYFSQNMVISDFATFFLQFLYFSKFLFQTFFKISQNLLVFLKKLWKHVL